MRVALEVLDLQSHDPHQLLDPFLQFLSARQTVGDQRLGDDVQHGHARVQRRVGVLEDHLHVPADLPQPALVQLGDVDRCVGGLELEIDRAVGGLDGTQDAPAQSRLAAAGLAYQAKCLPFVDVEVDPVDRLDVTGDAGAETPSRSGSTCATRRPSGAFELRCRRARRWRQPGSAACAAVGIAHRGRLLTLAGIASACR